MYKTIRNIVAALGFAALAVGTLAAQDKINIPFSDPMRPGMVKASVLNGSITVKAYDGKDVVVEAKVRDEGNKRGGRGMNRIPMTSTGLSAEEEDNKVSISVDAIQRTVDVTISVPVNTSLYLRSVNDGDIVVTGVSGEIDVNNINGEVKLLNIAGNAVAHALNGDVKVTFTSINAKPMAFSSMNGDIDVTFPATLKANVNLTNNQGDVYSDFDVVMQPTAPRPIVQERQGTKGRYKVQIDKSVRGAINGGGPEMQFKNFNGDIFIRKAGSSSAPAKED